MILLVHSDASVTRRFTAATTVTYVTSRTKAPIIYLHVVVDHGERKSWRGLVVRRGIIIFTDPVGFVSYFKLQLNPISLIPTNARSNYFRKALELLNRCTVSCCRHCCVCTSTFYQQQMRRCKTVQSHASGWRKGRGPVPNVQKRYKLKKDSTDCGWEPRLWSIIG